MTWSVRWLVFWGLNSSYTHPTSNDFNSGTQEPQLVPALSTSPIRSTLV